MGRLESMFAEVQVLLSSRISCGNVTVLSVWLARVMCWLPKIVLCVIILFTTTIVRGIYLGDYIGYTVGGTSGCYVVNNTLYHNNLVGGALNGSNNSENINDEKDSEGEIRLAENCTNNTIMNNLIYAVTDRDIFVRKYTRSGSKNKIGYNLYYSPTSANHKWFWDSVEYTNFSSWQKASGDENSLYNVDPKLVSLDISAPDLHLQSGSPAKNAGYFIAAYF